MASGDAADDARFLQVSNDDTNKFIDETKKIYNIRFFILPYSFIGNVTIDIYSSEK